MDRLGNITISYAKNIANSAVHIKITNQPSMYDSLYCVFIITWWRCYSINTFNIKLHTAMNPFSLAFLSSDQNYCSPLSFGLLLFGDLALKWVPSQASKILDPC